MQGIAMPSVDIESTCDTKSHFLPYCNGLRVFKLLGLPLKIDITDEHEVKFEDRLRFLRCGLEIATLMISHTMLMMLLRFQYGLKDVFTVMEKFGLTTWDMICMFIFLSRALCSSILQAITFKGMGKELSEFAVLYGQYPTLHNKNTKSLYKRIFWRITMMHILIFIAVASHSTIFLVHNMKSTSLTMLPLLISLFKSLLLYFMYFPPSVTVIYELVHFSLGMLRNGVQSYLLFLQTGSEKFENNSLGGKNGIIHNGFGVIKLSCKADTMLGGLIAIQISSFLVMTCILIFFVTQVFNVLRGDFRSVLQVPMGMASIPSTVVAITVVYTTSKEGHILADLFRKIRDRLDEIKMSEAMTMSVEERVHLDVLIAKFSRCSYIGPIMPLNIFNLNLRTAASMAGLALTYMLVLLKFRFGDTTKNDQVNILNNATLQYLINTVKNNTVPLV